MRPDTNSTASCMSDRERVRRAQEGDADAFATLFHENRARVYSLCLRMTNNTAEAEDLTQDAFLQVFRKLATFRGDSALSTWLYRVAVNTVLMHFRRKGLRPVSLDEPSPQDSRMVKKEYGTLDHQLSGSIDRIALARAIQELPYGYRTIFLLHEIKGYEHQEIARRLRCSVGNSKSQLHKAKLRLRELLGGRPEAATRAQVAPVERAPDAKQKKLPLATAAGPKPTPGRWTVAQDAAPARALFPLGDAIPRPSAEAGM